MDSIRFMSTIVTALLITTAHVTTAKPGIIVKTDKSQTVIGSATTLVIQITGTDINYVSWNLCDSSLKNIKNINVLQTISFGNGIRSLKYSIVFTSIKAGNIIIDHLPIVIHSPKGDHIIFTGRNIIKFTKEPLLTNIDDINPIVASGLLPFKYLLYISLSLVIITAAFVTKKSILKKHKEKLRLSPQKIRQAALGKLELLEHQVENATSTNNHLGDMIFDVLKDFLGQLFILEQFTGTEDELLRNIKLLPLEIREKELIIDVLNTSLNARFSIQNGKSLTVYLYKVKCFISSSTLPTPIKV